MSQLTRALLDGLLPQGDAWHPAPGGNLDKLLNGIADNLGIVQTALGLLDNVRDPWTTPYLDELERDFGITKNTMLTTAQRQANLAARKFQRNQPGTALALQTALNLMGFGVGGYGLQVYTNEGSADPRNFSGGVPYMEAGYTTPGYYQAGHTYAFAGISGGGGTLVVNGNLYSANAPNYFGAGMNGVSGYGYAGNNNMFAGYFTSLGLGYSQTTYTIGADSGYWPLYFFLATSATYSSGVIQTLGMAMVPGSRQQELYDLICRYKPIHTWCIVIAQWT
jgi:hypothetical protein